MTIALQPFLSIPPSFFISFTFSIPSFISIYLVPFSSGPTLSSSVFSFLFKPRCQPRSDRSAQVFAPRTPPFPKLCLLMTGSYEAEQETHFKDVGTTCLDWLALLKHTHRHRQARNFICPLNLWLRHIKIKMTLRIKVEPGGESLFSQTWLNTGFVVCR